MDLDSLMVEAEGGGDGALIAAIADSLVANYKRGRGTMLVSPFVVCVAPDTDDFYMSAALPVVAPLVPGEIDWRGALPTLDAVMAASGRALRLEVIEERFAGLSDALIAHGVPEITPPAPVLALTGPPRTLARTMPVEAEITLLGPEDAAGLADHIAVGQTAFEHWVAPDGQAFWQALIARSLATGTGRAALARRDGQPVGCGLVMGAHPAAELLGVGTVPAARGGGIATALCRALIDDHVTRLPDVPLWLSAGDDRAYGIYERLGFRRVATQRNFGRAPARPEGPVRPS